MDSKILEELEVAYLEEFNLFADDFGVLEQVVSEKDTTVGPEIIAALRGSVSPMDIKVAFYPVIDRFPNILSDGEAMTISNAIITNTPTAGGLNHVHTHCGT